MVTGAAFTGDGRYFISVSSNGIFRVWDVKRRVPTGFFRFPKYDCSDQLSQRANFLDYQTQDAKSRHGRAAVFATFHKGVEYPGKFSVSPDGKVLAIPASDNMVLFLELATGKLLTPIKTGHESLGRVCYSPDGRYLAAGGSEKNRHGWMGSVEIYDTATNRRVRSWKAHRSGIARITFSPDGKTLATGGGSDGVRVWDIATTKQLFRLHKDTKYNTRDIYGLAFLPDGSALVTTASDTAGYIRFWDPQTGAPLPFKPKPDRPLPPTPKRIEP